MSNSANSALGFALLIACSVSAFCLAVMSYTLVTGELPFDVQPLLPMEVRIEPQKVAPADEDGDTVETERLRDHEKFAARLYSELEQARERIAVEEENIAARQRVVEKLADNARKLQEEVARAETEIRRLLDVIDRQEQQNIHTLSQLVAEVEPQQAAEMLLQMDQAKAARLLYTMDRKNAATIMDAMLRGSDEGKARQVADLADRIHRLSNGL